MQNFRLIPHRSCRPDPTLSIECAVWRENHGICIDFALRGELHRLRLPDETPQVRRDELWQTTCFEAFLRPSGGSTYFELNISPSSAWAAYRFDDYRSGMTDASIEPTRDMFFMSDGAIWEQDVTFEVGRVSELTSAKVWYLGLSAIIEEADGTKSYWALAHPDGPPDFHDPSCFLARLSE